MFTFEMAMVKDPGFAEVISVNRLNHVGSCEGSCNPSPGSSSTLGNQGPIACTRARTMSDAGQAEKTR